MKERSEIINKSFDFAIQIYQLCKELRKQREYLFADQLLRSGTSIGANVEEGFGGHSLKEFAVRYSTAYKESRESKYWLRLIREIGIIPKEKTAILLENCEELIRMLGAAQKTLRSRLENQQTTRPL